MSKHALILGCALAAVAGCASKMENPTDFYTYRNQPLVKQVEEGMTETQVRNIGGPPSSSIRRKVNAGLCNNYILNQDGHQQAYHVSFDGSGRVSVGDQSWSVTRGDLFVVPSWATLSVRSEASASDSDSGALDLFQFSDAPVFERLGLFRTERGDLA